MTRLALWIGVAALALTALYSMTAIVHSGCEPSYNLVLKPAPMWGWLFGGRESDCYWSDTNPGVPEPWWLSAQRIVYASWEDTGGDNLRTTYLLGLLLTPLLWALLIATIVVRGVRGFLRNREPTRR